MIVLWAAIGCSVLVALSVIDLRYRRIPNVLTYPALASCLVLVAMGIVSNDMRSATPAIVGSLMFGGLLLLPHLSEPSAMGLGDVKLALVLGFAIGWVRADTTSAMLTVGWTLAAASILGLMTAAVANRGAGWIPARDQSVPFGPALSMAGAVAILWPMV